MDAKYCGRIYSGPNLHWSSADHTPVRWTSSAASAFVFLVCLRKVGDCGREKKKSKTARVVTMHDGTLKVSPMLQAGMKSGSRIYIMRPPCLVLFISIMPPEGGSTRPLPKSSTHAASSLCGTSNGKAWFTMRHLRCHPPTTTTSSGAGESAICKVLRCLAFHLEPQMCPLTALCLR